MKHLNKSISAFRNLRTVKTLTLQTPKQNYITQKSFNQVITKNLNQQSLFHFSKTSFNVPEMGDSITEGTILEVHKKVGEYVALDETFAIIETDKVQVEIKAQAAGVITQFHAGEGDNVEVGKPLYEVDTAAEAPAGQPAAAPKKEEAKPAAASTPSAPAQQQQAAPQQQQVQQPQQVQQTSASQGQPLKPQGAATTMAPPAFSGLDSRQEKREPMSRMRQKIAERLKESQNTYALLTTFQECDMSNVMEIRNKYQKDFQKKHDTKLGFMSFFIKAATHGLQKQPILNAVIDGKEIVYRNYVDISVAVATPNGLMVPVLRNCEQQGFADIEKNLIHLANKGKNGKITLEDMAGGTFTISNGGVFGSMMGTPILNPPQSAILGMHSIINRPVVRGDQIVARPMMYLALTYDHRLIDGREAATFLKQLANEIEDPRRILLDL